MWVYSQSGCQCFRVDSINSHASSQYHQDANPSQLLANRKAFQLYASLRTKASFQRSKLDLVNKFKIVFTMTKKRMSPDFFTDLCSAAELLCVPTMHAQPLENGQSPHGKIVYR